MVELRMDSLIRSMFIAFFDIVFCLLIRSMFIVFFDIVFCLLVHLCAAAAHPAPFHIPTHNMLPASPPPSAPLCI